MTLTNLPLTDLNSVGSLWNTFGLPVLGIPDFPSDPAPTIVVRIGLGIRVPGMFTLQGFIQDRAAPNGLAATTNAVVSASILILAANFILTNLLFSS